MPPSESEFLRSLNADLPPGVDWKAGAVTYLRELVLDGGPDAERYHLVKPFVGGPDFSSFWVDVFQFLDVIEKVDLGHRSRILDVGCGPGWTVHWLAKLGHEVVGLDISPELLAIAEQRMAADPHPPYPGQPFAYDLRVHDIEAAPLGLERPVDLALFESTLHHFENPVAALRNVAADLAPGGVLAVIEAAAPPVGSTWHAENVRLMERYHTIERPYTREQLLDLLELAGFGFARIFRPVNGLIEQDAAGLARVNEEVGELDNINVVLATTTAEALERLTPDVRPLADLRRSWEPVAGFSFPQPRPDGTSYRWCGPRGSVRCHRAGQHHLRVTTVDLQPRDRQTVYAVVGHDVQARVQLTAAQPTATLTIDAPTAGALVDLQSDRAFSPCWTGVADPRVLSFTVDLP